VDQHGKPFSNADLKGKFALLYFGFTHCPDICPDELVKMAEAIDLIGACFTRPCAVYNGR
jgi:protein SCO1/2